MTKTKNQNAVSHGVFAKALILPGEDPAEFEHLHDSLIAEWNPEGPTEYDTVASLANFLWRKRRFLRYRQRQVTRSEQLRSAAQEKGMKVAADLAQFLESAKSGTLGSITEQDLSTKLPKALADYCKAHLPRANYDSDSAWLPAIIDRVNLAEATVRADVKRAEMTEDVYFSEAQMTKELDVEERLDAMIDKTIKRLAQVNALKHIIVAANHPSVTNKPLKQIASPAIQAAEL